MRLRTKLQVCSSTRFGDVRVYANNFWGSRDLGHASILDFSLRVFEPLPLCVCVPNVKSLALFVLEIR